MGWQTVRDLIENAVVNSDNDSFIALRVAFDHDGYEGLDCQSGCVDDETTLDPMSDFPTYCPRTSRLVMARDERVSERGYRDFTVVVGPSGINIALIYSRWHCGRTAFGAQKGGWISEDGYYSTCDAGLIDVDGHRTL